MSYGSSQVIGLIECDAPWRSADNHPLRPVEVPKPHVRRATSPAPVDEIVNADLEQIDDDLRVELARVVACIAARRARKG